ncbi:MAG: hypothetical protein NTV23_04830 [Propionibacteriales bacterium]|nr:hypothetical protein [Propionibacteriales bacterium]
MTSSAGSPGSVVVGYDRPPEAARAPQWAAEQTSVEGRPLSVVHAISLATGYQRTGTGAGYLDPGTTGRSPHASCPVAVVSDVHDLAEVSR